MKTTMNLNNHYFVPLLPTHSFFGFVSLTTSSDVEHIVECKLEPYDFDGFDYKLYAVPVEDTELYSRKSFYTCDFESMVENGIIVEKTKDTMRVIAVNFEEPLCGKAVVRHSGEVVVED